MPSIFKAASKIKFLVMSMMSYSGSICPQSNSAVGIFLCLDQILPDMLIGQTILDFILVLCGVKIFNHCS